MSRLPKIPHAKKQVAFPFVPKFVQEVCRLATSMP